MIKILHNQNILDIAIQHTGDVSNAFLMANANNKSISDFLVAGDLVVIPQTVIKNFDILNYIAKEVQPATGSTEENTTIPTLRGIGYMRIGSTFKVS